MRPTRPALRRAVTVAALCTTTIGLAYAAPSAASAETASTFTVSAPVPVGSNPREVAVDSVNGLAYVALADGSGHVQVLDRDSGSVLATVTTGTASPNDIAVDPSTQLIYETAYGNSISVTTSGGTNQPALTVTGATSLGAMSLDAADHTMYVTGTSAGANGPFGGSAVLYAVDLQDGTSRTVVDYGSSMTGGASVLAVDPTTGVAYTGTGYDTVADLATGAISSLPALGSAIALDPLRNALWTANDNGSASLIDTRTGKLVVTVPLGGSASAVAIDPNAGFVYVANSSYNSVSVIDEDTRAVVSTVPVDANPVALAVDPTTHATYVVNSGSDGTVSVIVSDTETVSRTQTVTFTSTPPAKAYVQGTYTATAAGGGSGNRVHFSTDPRAYGVCNVSLRGAVLFAKAGTCIVDADQDGSGPWSDAPTATQTITVVLRSQTITFPKPATLKVRRTQTLRATSSAKLPVTYTVATPKTCSVSRAVVSAKAAGTCRITANAAATTVYAKATAKSVSFSVTR